MSEDPGLEKATFAGGCSRGLADVFRRASGVVSVVPGYTCRHVSSSTHEQVCSGTTGHAGGIQIVFDPRRVAYGQLLRLFVCLRAPTQLDRQGPEYRLAVFYHNARQKAEAESVVAELEASGQLAGPLVTRIEPAGSFWPADD
ncbi:peptide-methionine (S)-S-oxide reductase [Chloroflexota bacterium]